jgi:hypothetical protein
MVHLSLKDSWNNLFQAFLISNKTSTAYALAASFSLNFSTALLMSGSFWNSSLISAEVGGAGSSDFAAGSGVALAAGAAAGASLTGLGGGLGSPRSK